MRKIIILCLLLSFVFISCSEVDDILDKKLESVDINFSISLEDSNSTLYNNVQRQGVKSLKSIIEAKTVLGNFITVTVKVGNLKTYTFNRLNNALTYICEEDLESKLSISGEFDLKKFPCGEHEVSIFAQSMKEYNETHYYHGFGVALYHGPVSDKSGLEDIVNDSANLYRVYECIEIIESPLTTAHTFVMKPVNDLFAINIDKPSNFDVAMYISKTCRLNTEIEYCKREKNSWLAWYLPCNNDLHMKFTTVFQDQLFIPKEYRDNISVNPNEYFLFIDVYQDWENTWRHREPFECYLGTVKIPLMDIDNIVDNKGKIFYKSIKIRNSNYLITNWGVQSSSYNVSAMSSVFPNNNTYIEHSYTFTN